MLGCRKFLSSIIIQVGHIYVSHIPISLTELEEVNKQQVLHYRIQKAGSGANQPPA